MNCTAIGLSLILKLCFCFIIISACSPTEQTKKSTVFDTSGDPHSYSDPDSAAISHMDLSLKVDFQKKILTGLVTYEIAHKKASQIIFDCKGLNIRRVLIGENKREVEFTLGKNDPILGQSLIVPIAPLTKVVSIEYETTADSEALQWVTPEQTATGKHPFLYTQGQPILTRTWIPIQDSPGIRFTYTAQIQVPGGLLALMSANNPQQIAADGKYSFKMDHKIPAYLIALAVGDLEFATLGSRSGVYAENPLLEKAVYEFALTEKMIEAAENLYGEYKWGRYDILVLPPSYPFGGMENPMLTFATPTILAGDRSLTALVAHELAHSWSGNLVTNSNWNNIWLNEGFTVYFERRIMEKVHGMDMVNMMDLLTYNQLHNLIKRMGEEHPDTRLYIDLDGRDPDEGLTRIAYDKGYFFLKMLEQKFKRPVFDEFLREYFREFAFQSMDTRKFIEYLEQKLFIPQNKKVNIEEWIFEPGLPTNCPVPKSDRLKKIESQYEEYIGKNDLRKLQVDEWSAQEWLHFISIIPIDLSLEKMRELDRQFNISNSGNAEILAAWYKLSVLNGYGDEIMDKITAFLKEIGRRKFLVPIYTALRDTDRLDLARNIYRQARPKYHAISANTIDEILK